jgi:hypothetical protein
MKIDLGLAAVIGSAIIGVSIVVGSSIIAGKPNFVKISDLGLLDSTTGDKFFSSSLEGGVPTFDEIPGPTDRRAKIERVKN